ncbi:amidohydrolase family protein [Zavarzinella formosa]|uniref:amidohydrolase family protein n=1 Tax=Zavarzinella formosa TaxID=360055 RepID=UPI0002ECE86B|nr:amidohydrolase family protein [Zavarzinella formosa]
MNYIDAHVHVWTPDTIHYKLATGFAKEDMKPPSFTPDELFKHSKPAGVTRVNLIQMSFYGFDNSYMTDMIRVHDGVFVGTAVIDPQAEPVKRMRELAPKKVRAFRILPTLTKAKKWLEPDGYSEMFAEGAKANQAMSCLINPADLPELDRMCAKFPDTPVIIDHLCRIGGDGTIRDADVTALCDMAKHKQVMVKVGAFYAFGAKKPPYADLIPLSKAVIKAFGVKRCMWETDCPFQVGPGHTYQDSVNFILKQLDFLTADERDWLMRRTAEEFFFKKK